MVAQARHYVHGNRTSLAERIQISASCKECGEVKTRQIFVRTVFPVAGTDSINQLGISRLQRLIVKPCALKSLNSPVGNQYVCRVQKLKEGFLACRILHIKGNAALVTVLQIPGGVLIHIQRSALRGSRVS